MALSAACGGSSASKLHAPASRYVVRGEAAAGYNTAAADGDALRGTYAPRLGRAIERAARDTGLKLAPDARLGELAAWIADVIDPQGSPPPNDAIDLMTHHLGLVEPAPHLVILALSDPGLLEDHVATELARLMHQQRYTHYGAVSIERDGSTLVVVALSWRWLTLTPIPRAVEPGTPLRLEGRLLSGVHDAQLVAVAPDGVTTRSDPQPGDRIALPLPTAERGEYRIELLGNSALGETVVANFPLYVGIAPRTEVEVAADTESNLSAADAAARLLQLLNADRKQHGLPALTSREDLARIASAHSEDMRAHGFIGHTSPTTRNPEDRVRAAGIRTQLVLENIGRGYSPEEVERGLMESPGHRENVLNPLATHVGIGVAIERDDQRVAYLVTQLFARFAAKIDLGGAPQKLLESINAARERRGVLALASDRTLAGLCDSTASQVFKTSAPSRQELVEQLNQKAARAQLPYKRITALLTLISALDDVASLDTVLDPRAHAIGIAVTQGTRSDTVENAIAVVLVLGY